VRSGMKSDVIAPPPEVTGTHARPGRARDGGRGTTSGVSAIDEGPRSAMNIGPSEVVAPAPQLTLAEQHSLRRAAEDVCRAEASNRWDLHRAWLRRAAGASGRLIALGIHPVAPTGPVVFPEAIAVEHSPPIRRESRAPRERRIWPDRNRMRRAPARGTRTKLAAAGPACGRGDPAAKLGAQRAQTSNGDVEWRSARWRAFDRQGATPVARVAVPRFPTTKSPMWTARFLAASASMDDAEHAEPQFLDRQLGDKVRGT
jgi:hypothetical protein